MRLPADPIARRNRAIRDGLSLAGVIVASFIVWYAATVVHDIGFDAHAYWGFRWDDLYHGAVTADGFEVYRYSPAFAQLLAPLSLLPFEAFLAIWIGLLIVALAWLGRSWTVALLVLPFVVSELVHGNIHLLMAVVVVVGFTRPWTWSFILLTKVTPGVGLVWFGVRREWRNLAIAIAATVAIVLASAALFGIGYWQEWLGTLTTTRPAEGGNQIPIPLLPRLVVAVVLVAWAAVTDRRWVLPIVVVLALPTIWFHGLAILVAIVPIVREERARTNVLQNRAADRT